MCRGHHKVPARRLARSISFNTRLAFRARSRFGPGSGGSSWGRRREHTSQADWRGLSALLLISLRRAFLITADLVLFLRRANLLRARPISASSRIVTVSPMSYIVRHALAGVKGEVRARADADKPNGREVTPPLGYNRTVGENSIRRQVSNPAFCEDFGSKSGEKAAAKMYQSPCDLLSLLEISPKAVRL